MSQVWVLRLGFDPALVEYRSTATGPAFVAAVASVAPGGGGGSRKFLVLSTSGLAAGAAAADVTGDGVLMATVTFRVPFREEHLFFLSGHCALLLALVLSFFSRLSAWPAFWFVSPACSFLFYPRASFAVVLDTPPTLPMRPVVRVRACAITRCAGFRGGGGGPPRWRLFLRSRAARQPLCRRLCGGSAGPGLRTPLPKTSSSHKKMDASLGTVP